jgi:Initiator Replication protein
MGKPAQTGIAADEHLPVAHRRDQGRRSCYKLYPVARMRPDDGTGKSGSLFDVQSELRADWLESKKHLPNYVEQKPANIGLRSQYALRLYSWAKKYIEKGTKSISLEELRKVLGLESVKDPDGNVIQEAPLPVWANFRQRALDTAIAEIDKKTDLKIGLDSLEQSKHRRVTALTFAIEAQAVPNDRNTGGEPQK